MSGGGGTAVGGRKEARKEGVGRSQPSLWTMGGGVGVAVGNRGWVVVVRARHRALGAGGD